MLVVETIAKIRRAFFKQGKPIKAICRELGVSRKVVRRVIRSGATEFRYQREDQPLPKIGRWRDTLDQLLAQNEAKSSRERLTLIRLFEELRGRGYDGGYDAVRRYARRWAQERGQATAAAFVPLSFAPGEAYQFDWSHEIVLLSGATVTVKVAHVRLCHSRMLFVRAYPRETQEMVFDAHDRAFALFRGTCGRGIYDNMKTAVETIFVGRDRRYNRRFLQMCSHYLVDPVACTPASGWEMTLIPLWLAISLDRHCFWRLRKFRARDNLLLMSGMQSLNVALDAPIAFAAAPLQRVPVDNLHVAAAANDRPIFLKVSGDQRHGRPADRQHLRERVVHKRDFIVATAVIQLEQPAGDAAFHLMGSIANGVLLHLGHHCSVVAGG
jgi:transposase